MPVVIVTLNAPSTVKQDLEDLILDGEIIGAKGLINLKWEDFSAIDIARDVRLHGIAWEATCDDTPGYLSLTVHYPDLTREEIEAKFENRDEVEEYEIQKPLILVRYD